MFCFVLFFNSSYEEECPSHVKAGKGAEVEHEGTKVKGEKSGDTGQRRWRGGRRERQPGQSVSSAFKKNALL